MKKIILYPFGTAPDIQTDLQLVSGSAQIAALGKRARNERGACELQATATLQSLSEKIGPLQSSDALWQAERLMILQHLMKDWEPGEFGKISDTPGFLQDVLDWISRNRGAGIGADAFLKSDFTPHRNLGVLYQNYEAFLRSQHLHDLEEIMIRSLPFAEEYEIGRIDVSGYLDFRPLELDFLDALSKKNEVTIHLPYGERREGGFMKNLLERFKVRGYEIESKSDHHEQGLPEVTRIAGSNPTLLGKVAIERIAESTDRYSDVDIVVTDDSLLSWIEREATASGLPLTYRKARRLSETRVGREILTLSALLFEGRNPNRLLKRNALTLYEPMEEESELPSLPADVVFDMDAFRQAVFPEDLRCAILDRESDAQETSVEIRAVEIVERILERAEAMKKSLRLDASALPEYLDELFGEVTVPEPSEVQGVRLLTLRECAQVQSPVRLIVGLDEAYPRTEEPNFLLRPPYSIADRFPHSGYLTEEEAYKKEACRLYDAIRFAGTLTLGTVASNGGEKESLSPLLRQFFDPIPVIRSNRVRFVPIESSVFTKRDRTIWSAGNRPHAKRRPIGAWVGEGTFLAKEVPSTYTPAMLTEYANCPFRYFIGSRIGPIVVEEPGYAQRRGNLIHEILKEYLDRKKDDINLALKSRKIPETDVELLSRIIDGLTADDEELSRAWTVDDLKQRIEAFLAEDMLRLYDAEEFFVSDTEASFDIPLSAKDASIRIKGRMDRVDRADHGKAWVLDYKTGKGHPSKKQLNDLLEFQLPVYSLVNRSAHVGYAMVMKGGFTHTYAPEKTPPGGANRFSDAEWSTLLERVQEGIREIDGRIKKGEFPAIESERCAYCDFDAICRKGER